MSQPAKPKVYIDGQAGTTGLQIAARLENRQDLQLLKLPDDKRHDDKARKAIMKEADLVFLCLPDAAAIEAVKLCDPTTKIIDASTAHRTKWTYGFAELDEKHRKDIQSSMKVANPGCHATGMISLLYPLVQSGLLKPDAFVSVFSLTGYSGGGKKMIAQYESENLEAARPYALSLSHKHLPETVKVTGLETTPAFLPVVDNFYKGMLTSLVITPDMLTKPAGVEDIRQLYQTWYLDEPLIQVAANKDEGNLAADAMAGKDGLEIHVNGNDGQILLQSLFDNLGKGASGAAVQNMNLMLGLEPLSGLNM